MGGCYALRIEVDHKILAVCSIAGVREVASQGRIRPGADETMGRFVSPLS